MTDQKHRTPGAITDNVAVCSAVEEKSIEVGIRPEMCNDDRHRPHQLHELPASHESPDQSSIGSLGVSGNQIEGAHVSALKAQLHQEMQRNAQLRHACASQDAQIGELDKEIRQQRNERQKAVDEGQRLDAEFAELVVQEAFLLLEIDSQQELTQGDVPRNPIKKGKARRKKGTRNSKGRRQE
jgi:hypothetical protein